MQIAIVAAEFHPVVMDEMIREAKNKIKAVRAQLVSVTRVPGSYEIPLIVQNLLQTSSADGIVVLGWIEKGKTLHGEVMGYVVHAALMDLQLKFQKPIGFGIIGPGATLKQAKKRAQPVACRAVEAVWKMQGLI